MRLQAAVLQSCALVDQIADTKHRNHELAVAVRSHRLCQLCGFQRSGCLRVPPAGRISQSMQPGVDEVYEAVCRSLTAAEHHDCYLAVQQGRAKRRDARQHRAV